MAERRFEGLSASSGLAIGTLIRVDDAAPSAVQLGNASADEEAALRAAMTKAAADLEALSNVATGDGADILAFQIEMLTDPALIGDVIIGIRNGQGAFEAWCSGLQDQIDEYRNADDDYFRARASDLDDLKDRVCRALSGTTLAAPDLVDGSILLSRDLTPSRFLALDVERLSGIALQLGSVNSHVSMLARARGLPMIVGLGDLTGEIGKDVDEAVLDAEEGLLLMSPTSSTRQRYQQKLSTKADQASIAMAKRHLPAITSDGQKIDVMLNIDQQDMVDDDTLKASDGVGLMRTEFLFLGRPDLPGEDEQYHEYRRLLERLDGRPVIIRTLDIGGDKPLPGIQTEDETNPFLGLRGIRFCLAHEALFKVQVRALLRAASGQSLKVMLPMVSTPSEIEQAKAMFKTCLEELRSEGLAAEMPPLGIMIETPAAAIAIDQLDAAFYSIGSNDLIQYVMAASRDASGAVADLLDPAHPAIARLIEQVVAQGVATDKEVSLCGDMASDPGHLPMLLNTGLKKISVAPAALGRVKSKIADIDLGEKTP